MKSHYSNLLADCSKLDKTIGVGLLVAVVFTALAHGAVESWSVAIFELIIVALIVLWAIKIVKGGRFEIYIPATTLPLAALLAVGLAQSLAFADSAGRTSSLSVDVEATRATVLALLFLLVSFVIAGNFFEGRERLRSLIHFLIIYGLMMALFALVQHFTWNGRFYWLRPDTAERSMPFGPFVNRNHFAGYMELLMPLPVAMVITHAARRDTRLFHVFAAAMMGVAAVVSLSRGGMVSIAAEMIFIAMLSVCGNRTQRRRDTATRRHGKTSMRKSSLEEVIPASPRRRVWVSFHPSALTILLAALIVAGIFWIGSEPVVNRLLPSQAASAHSNTETFFTSRGWIWRDTVAMIRANPFLGVGLGAYETAYPIYSRDDGSLLLGQSYAVDRSHNDYLQILADCGFVGVAIALWFIVLVFRAVARGVKSRDPLMAGIALGCGASIFGILVHSLFDFNLQLPSNALLFLLLAAVASRTGASCQLALQEEATQKRASYQLADQEGVSL